MSSQPCQECGALFSHSPNCERQTLDEWKATALQYYGEWLKWNTANQLRSKRLKEQIAYWQGKYLMLKHENNKLRSKLYPNK